MRTLLNAVGVCGNKLSSLEKMVTIILGGPSREGWATLLSQKGREMPRAVRGYQCFHCKRYFDGRGHKVRRWSADRECDKCHVVTLTLKKKNVK